MQRRAEHFKVNLLDAVCTLSTHLIKSDLQLGLLLLRVCLKVRLKALRDLAFESVGALGNLAPVFKFGLSLHSVESILVCLLS